jgi:hypothetical protein
MAAGRGEELRELLLGGRWLEAKAEHGLVFDLPLGFAAARQTEGGDPARRRNLNLFEEALRRDIHFIARHSGLLFQCLWNTGWWYDCPDAAVHYDPPAGGWPPEGPPWARPASERISTLLELRRTARQQLAPGAVWLRSLRPPDIPLGGALLAVFRGHEDGVRSVAIDAVGLRIVSGSHDETVRVWDAESGRALACLRGHEYPVLSVAFDAAGRRIVSGQWDKTVRVWDAESGVCLELIPGKRDVMATAAGATSYPWRALHRGFETVIERASDGQAVAWFPAALNHITTHPSGRIWAGSESEGHHLYLIRLEGPDEEGGTTE